MQHSFTRLAIFGTFVAIATNGSGQTNKVFRTFMDVPYETLNAERGNVDSLHVGTYTLFEGDSTVVKSENVLVDSDADVEINAQEIYLNSYYDIDLNSNDDVWIDAQDQFLVDVDGEFYIGVYSDIGDLEDDIENDATSFASDSDDGAIFIGADYGDIILSVGAFYEYGDPGSAGIEMVEDDEEIHMYAGNGIHMYAGDGIYIRGTYLWTDIPPSLWDGLYGVDPATLPSFIDLPNGRINLSELAAFYTLQLLD